MRAFVHFIRGLNQMSLPFKIWTLVLAVVNVIVPLFFIFHVEAQLALGVFAANIVALTSLTALLGYTRLVSLGHALWLPLIYFFWLQLPEYPIDTAFGIWLRAIIFFNAIALLLDAIDVIRYLRGERAPLV